MEQTPPCPICSAPENRRLTRCDTAADRPGPWTLVECTACGMVYLAQRVGYRDQAADFDWPRTFRAGAKRRDRQMPVARSISRRLRWLKRLFRPGHGSGVLRRVRRHKSQGCLCDFGCGSGRLLMAASETFDVWGVDISQETAAVAQERLPRARIVVGPVTQVRLPAERFDAVTMLSYLEHEQHPIAALEVARRILKPGGVLVLKTPNYASWNRRIRGAKWCGFRFPDHCNYFTPPTLQAALHTAGLQALPGSLFDRLPTSDNMYAAARKP